MLDGLGAPRPLQPSVQAVYPGVVGADDVIAAARAFYQFMSAVAASVVESPQCSVSVPASEYALPLDLGGSIAARLAQAFFMAEELPGAVKDGSALQHCERGILITIGVQGMGAGRVRIITGARLLEHCCGYRHGGLPPLSLATAWVGDYFGCHQRAMSMTMLPTWRLSMKACWAAWKSRSAKVAANNGLISPLSM